MNKPASNTILFSLIIFCVTIQWWLALVAISAFFPPANALSQVVWPEWQHMVRPERDSFFYHFVVGFALVAQAIGVWFARHRMSDPLFGRQLLPFLGVELVWTILMLNASFKIIVYSHSPWLARYALAVLFIGSLLTKIFWPEIKQGAIALYGRVMSYVPNRRTDVLACLGLVLLLYVPDTSAVLARMWMGDYLRHFDSFMAPAWGYTKGAILNVDIMTEYGIGTPIMMSWFARLMGEFSYPHVLWFWMGGTILYFVLTFIFLRCWLKSFALALIGTLLAIKFQMFHPGVAPFVFNFPSATVMRYFWDIVFFLFLWGHLSTFKKRYLYAAAICVALQIFCMPTCGYCLGIALLAYVTALMVLDHLRVLACPQRRDMLILGGSLLMVPLTTVILLAVTQGHHLTSREFWYNMQEFHNYFLSGFGLMPIYETLQKKEILAGLMGFFIPVVYLGTFLVTAGLLFYRKLNKEDLMAPVLSLYGLALYHYYIGRSAPTSYYVVCIPYVVILCFWAKKALALLAPDRRRAVLVLMAAVVVYGLLTNHQYIAYPNMLNVSRNPIVDPLVVQPLQDGRSYFNDAASKVPEDQKIAENSLGEKDEGLKYEKDFKTDAELKAYYTKEFDFSRDAALITSLTKPSETVPLLSSFEIRILMQANRQPFFYYSPILIARPMRMRNFPNSTMYSRGHQERTLRQLEKEKPQQIFMEKIYLRAPGFTNFQDTSLAAVLNYIFTNYTPDAQGEYLVSMKRK